MVTHVRSGNSHYSHDTRSISRYTPSHHMHLQTVFCSVIDIEREVAGTAVYQLLSLLMAELFGGHVVCSYNLIVGCEKVARR